MTPTASLPLSLEFFPPKTPEGVTKLAAVRQALYALQPQFCSVTYGAGGSTQDGTLQTVQALLDEGQDGASHFTCVGATRESVRERLAQFRAMGMRRIVALRGDLPSGFGPMGEVAAYPQMPPQARSPQADLQAFEAKVKAGASSAITQFFYNADAYWRFMDEVRRLGLDIPVVPGIMPITNSSGILRFADGCGAEIPRWVRLRLQSFGDDTASIKAFGLDVVTDLCERLRAQGAPSLHFYTMNTSATVLELARRLGL